MEENTPVENITEVPAPASVPQTTTGLTIADIDEQLLNIARSEAYQPPNRRGAARLAETAQMKNWLIADKAKLQALETPKEEPLDMTDADVANALFHPPGPIDEIARGTPTTFLADTVPSFTNQPNVKQGKYDNVPTGIAKRITL